ncbi:hypothetical protein GWI33_007771, partial [Rhynchophorus ferrugineus]
KQEPVDDTRNDSGVTSGSDCPSASPGSDRCDNNPFNTPPQDPISRNSGEHCQRARNRYNPWYGPNFSTPSTSRGVGNTQRPPSTENKGPAMDDNSLDYADISVPKINSHGKMKVHRCKQCEFVAYTKLDFWKHSSVHIREEKALKCPKCPFVTEFKHHLEYHIMNHQGAKPYKCKLCSYSCVNNSMLRSHMKSHSKIYQYRCMDCLYETKYVHSLKLHLRKYGHNPAIVLNPDGTPNPDPVIDVYGSRRGPKTKKVASRSSGQITPFTLSMVPGLANAFPNPEMFQNFQMVQDRLQQITQPPQEEIRTDGGALDLSKPPSRSSEVDGEEEEPMRTAFSNVEVVENRLSPTGSNTNETPVSNEIPANNEALNFTHGQNSNSAKYGFNCEYCGIGFNEEVMFRIHMGYHGFGNPFTCNMCGVECGNSVNFFLHIARTSH